ICCIQIKKEAQSAMKLSEAKTILRQVKLAKGWEELKEIYDRYPECQVAPDGFSPIYNKFTARKQRWEIEQMKVGEKVVLYLCLSDRGREWFTAHPHVEKHTVWWNGLWQVQCWTG